MRFLTRWRPGPVMLGLVAAAAAVAAVPASASADISQVVGHVYVDDNTAGTNTIGAFRVEGANVLPHQLFDLRPIPRFPFCFVLRPYSG